MDKKKYNTASLNTFGLERGAVICCAADEYEAVVTNGLLFVLYSIYDFVLPRNMVHLGNYNG